MDGAGRDFAGTYVVIVCAAHVTSVQRALPIALNFYISPCVFLAIEDHEAGDPCVCEMV